jgi:WD40 repeat protein
MKQKSLTISKASTAEIPKAKLPQLRRFTSLCSWCLCGVLLFPLAPRAQNTTEETQNYHNLNRGEQISFSKQVAPIFQTKCAGCHSKTANMGGFVLTDFDSLMKGGSHGVAIIPSHGSESRLVKMLEGSMQPRMPMGGQLEEQEIATIRLWIDQGARLDQEAVQMDSLHEPEIPKIKAAASLSPEIGAVTFSPDGSLIASGSYGSVVFFDAAKGGQVGQLTGITETVRSVAFSPDGKYFATGAGRPGQVGEIKIWDTGVGFWNRLARQTVRAHRDCVYALAFSPDSRILASTSYDHMIFLWDPANGEQVKTLKEHTDAVFDLAFSPDGKWLASGGADRTVKLWDIVTGKRIHTLGNSTEGVNTIAFHPSKPWIAASGFDKTIHVWDLSKEEPVEIFSIIAHEEPVLRLAFSPDGNWLVTSSWDKSVKVWNTKTMEQSRVIPDQRDWVVAMRFSPDGRKLVLGRYDGSISVYETSGFTVVAELLGDSPALRAQLKH